MALKCYYSKPLRDAVSLASDVRALDLEEWRHGIGGAEFFIPRLKDAMYHSSAKSVVNEKGDCVAAWGISEKYPGSTIGAAWMVATNEALRRVHEMHRFFQAGIESMHVKYPIIHALAWAGNPVHHKWMERFGFERQNGIVTINNAPFILFVRRRQ